MRDQYNQQLEKLHDSLEIMGALCVHFIGLAATGDPAKAEEILCRGHEVDEMERDIERLCLRLLLRQQPVASDLRQVSAALKMITDLERIGDQAEDIASIVVSAGHAIPEISSMGASASAMVHDSVRAFVKEDLELARSVAVRDDLVDSAFERIKHQLMERIMVGNLGDEDPLDVLMAAKYFERIGDHAVNVSEWVVFGLTGMHPKMAV